MIKVLVTGGAGFIGFHLVKYLIKKTGYEVHLVDNLSRGKMDSDLKELLNFSSVHFTQADLTDCRAFSLFDSDYNYIYHLAAIIGVKNVLEHPDNVLYVNAISLLNLLEWIKNHKENLKRLLFTSTSEVYAGTLKHYGIPIPTPETVNLTVEDIYAPRTTYALSKMYGESACLTYASKYHIPVTIVRYHNVYGPRMGFSHVIPELFVRASREKEQLGVYSVNHTRAFCYVDDAIEATVKLAESEQSINEIVHVGNSKEEISIEQLAKYIIDMINPSLLLKPLGEQEGSTSRRCPDTKKLEQLTGFTPKISLQEGLKKSWGWYQNHIK